MATTHSDPSVPARSTTLTLQRFMLTVCLAAAISGTSKAGVIVGHDINTLGTTVASANEATFAVNVASLLTAGTDKDLLLFESNPGDGTRDYASSVLTALTDAGFSVTVTDDYSTAYSAYDAIFVAQDYPATDFLDNNALISYVDGGGGVYLAGGVGNNPVDEEAGWNAFLSEFGLAFDDTYNSETNLPVTSAHPLFAGVSSLNCGAGQYITSLGTDPNAQILEFSGSQGVYAMSGPWMAWSDQGCALTGGSGDPLLIGTGTLADGSSNAVDLSNAAPSAAAGMFIALSSTPVPFKAGTLKPFPPLIPPVILQTDSTGAISTPFIMPSGIPAGTELWFQWGIQDVAAIHAVALSNAIKGVTP